MARSMKEKIEHAFIKNNMCDCGEDHIALTVDETEFFDITKVVSDLETLWAQEQEKYKQECAKYYHSSEEVDQKISRRVVEVLREIEAKLVKYGGNNISNLGNTSLAVPLSAIQQIKERYMK